MGNNVNSGHCNDELVDNLLESGYIRSKQVEQVFRAVDRADYILSSHRNSAYKNIAWKHGHIHLSAPCIYSEVMEGLALEPGMSFLNLGSGTGYLSTMAGLILNQHGTNHGIELYEDCLKYSYERLEEFKQKSLALDKFDFCEPYFVHGNCLNAIPGRQYDRVYCGAACPESHETFIKRFVRVGGILVMPYKDYLLRIKRVDENSWITKATLPVSFASLVVPPAKESAAVFHLPDCEPLSLQELCRGRIRQRLRQNVWCEHAEVEFRRTLSRPILSRGLSSQQRDLIHIFNHFEDNPFDEEEEEEGETDDEDAGEDQDRGRDRNADGDGDAGGDRDQDQDQDRDQDRDRDQNRDQDDNDFLFTRRVRRVLFNVDPTGSNPETFTSIRFVRAVIQPDLDDQASIPPQQQQQQSQPQDQEQEQQQQQQQQQQRVDSENNNPLLDMVRAVGVRLRNEQQLSLGSPNTSLEAEPTSSNNSSSSNNGSRTSSSNSSSSSNTSSSGSLGSDGSRSSSVRKSRLLVPEHPQPQSQPQQQPPLQPQPQPQRQLRGMCMSERWSYSSSDSEDDNDKQRKKAPRRDASSDLSSSESLSLELEDEQEGKAMETDDVYRPRNSCKKNASGTVQPPVAHYTDMSAFSGYMKAKIQDLPLPHSLKLYVNYNRIL